MLRICLLSLVAVWGLYVQAERPRIVDYKCPAKSVSVEVFRYPDSDYHLQIKYERSGKVISEQAQVEYVRDGMKLSIPNYSWTTVDYYDDGVYDGTPSVLVSFRSPSGTRKIVCQFYGW